MSAGQVRVASALAPAPVRELPAVSPKVVFCDGDPAPSDTLRRASEGVEGDIVLLADGQFWLEPLVDQLVERHRASGNRTTVCNLHAGFSPIITSAAEIGKLPPKVPRLLGHLLAQVEVPGSGVGQLRPAIADQNVYLRTDQPEGWRCFAWVARCGRERGRWNVPVEFRAGQVEVRENYRAAFRAMNVFRPLEGLSVLEVGCSPRNTAGPRMLLEEWGVRQYTGVNLERIYFEWRHPAASFHVGDANEAPFAPGSFDLAFSIAVWEHVQNPRVLFHKVTGWLARGGGHYGQFQVWSAPDGYHLPPAEYLGKRPPPFGHLTMSAGEFRASLLADYPDEAAVDRAVEQVFHSDYINRVRAAEFLDIIRACGLEIVYLDGCNGGWLQHDAPAAARAAGKGYTAEELSVKGFEFYLRKSDFRLADLGAGGA